MTARRNSRTYRSAEAARAKVLSAQEELVGREEPMRRWPHAIPVSTCPAQVQAQSPEADASPAMTQVLEQMQCQSQLLVDLLGAVNSLTAAVLCQKGKN